MARAYQQSQPVGDDHDHSPAEWQSLRQELRVLLDQVDGQVARARAGDRPRESAYADTPNEARHRDALRSVQHAITHIEEPAPQPMPPNPRDSLQAAINQIRASQGAGRARMAPQPAANYAHPAAAPAPAPRAPDPAPW